MPNSPLKTASPAKLSAWIASRVAARETARVREAKQVMSQLLDHLANEGPAYTGASSGQRWRGWAVIRPSHPAYGMTIGNQIGDSGWQMGETPRRKGQPVRVFIKNPMWDHYLVFVETGHAPHAHTPPGFVRDAYFRIVRMHYGR